MTKQAISKPGAASWIEVDIKTRIDEVKILLALGMPYRIVNKRLARDLVALKSLLALSRRRART